MIDFGTPITSSFSPRTLANLAKSLYQQRVCALCVYIMSNPLTLSPITLEADMKMLGRSSGNITSAASGRWRDLIILDCITEAVRAIKGADVSALNPPMLVYDFRNSFPLQCMHNNRVSRKCVI